MTGGHCVAAANIELFDFDGAEHIDRMNSGRHTIDGGRLIIRMQDQLPDIVTPRQVAEP